MNGLDNISAYRMVYFTYAFLGLIKFVLTWGLSKEIEADKALPEEDPATTPLLQDENGSQSARKQNNWKVSLLPSICEASKVIVVKLCIMLALDAFGSGLVPM